MEVCVCTYLTTIPQIFGSYKSDSEREREKLTFVRFILVRWSFDFNNGCHSQKNREMCFFCSTIFCVHVYANKQIGIMCVVHFVFLSLSLSRRFFAFWFCDRRYLHINSIHCNKRLKYKWHLILRIVGDLVLHRPVRTIYKIVEEKET